MDDLQLLAVIHCTLMFHQFVGGQCAAVEVAKQSACCSDTLVVLIGLLMASAAVSDMMMHMGSAVQISPAVAITGARFLNVGCAFLNHV